MKRLLLSGVFGLAMAAGVEASPLYSCPADSRPVQRADVCRLDRRLRHQCRWQLLRRQRVDQYLRLYGQRDTSGPRRRVQERHRRIVGLRQPAAAQRPRQSRQLDGQRRSAESGPGLRWRSQERHRVCCVVGGAGWVRLRHRRHPDVDVQVQCAQPGRRRHSPEVLLHRWIQEREVDAGCGSALGRPESAGLPRGTVRGPADSDARTGEPDAARHGALRSGRRGAASGDRRKESGIGNQDSGLGKA